MNQKNFFIQNFIHEPCIPFNHNHVTNKGTSQPPPTRPFTKASHVLNRQVSSRGEMIP